MVAILRTKRTRRWSRVPPDIELAMCEAYRRTGRTAAIVRQFRTNRQTLHNVLRRHGVPLFPRELSGATVRALIWAYKAGTPLSRLCREFSISRRPLLSAFTRANVRLRTASECRRLQVRPHRFTSSQEAKICAMYVGGHSLNEVARRFGVAVTTIRRVLRRNGIRMRSIAEAMRIRSSQLEKQRFTPAQERRICRWYGAELWSMKRIVRRVRATDRTVKRILVRHHVRIRTMSEVANLTWSRRRRGTSRARAAA
jgi:lambda repressor-like predicted transcriptional regulator